MNRFLSNATKKIDSKGRVSVPANFRSVLARLDVQELYGFQDFLFPAFNLGGPEILDRYERLMAAMDPFSQEAHRLSLLIHGGGSFLKLDGEGRLMITDFIRDHAGLADEVTFVGRSDHFQLWAPAAFEAMRRSAREEWAGNMSTRSPRKRETG